jgi:dimethylaniline monooxygenase (N-oxide forming)
LVLGAGCIGLAAAKELLEQNCEVTVLEKKDDLGGLWNYTEGNASVTPTTWATTSRAFLQFSDFPMGAEMGEFPAAGDYVEYLRRYAEHFKVTSRIRFQQDVLSLGGN